MVFIRKPWQRLSDSPWRRGQQTLPGWSGTDDIDWTLVLPRLTVNPVKHLPRIRLHHMLHWSASYCSKTFYSLQILNFTRMFYLVSKDSCCIDKLYHIQQISGNIEHQDLISAFLRFLGDTSVLSETLFSLHLLRKCVRLWRKKMAVKEMSLCERRWRIAAGWDTSTNNAFVIRSSMWSFWKMYRV